MDRLTARNDNGSVYYPKCFEEPCMGMDEALEECKTCKMTFDIAERLAAYEDLEVLPEQLRELDGIYREVCEKLAEYQKLEEQGLLFRLPCKMEDTVWDIDFAKPCSYEVTGFSYGSLNEDDYKDEEKLTDEVIVYYKNWNGSITGSFPVGEIGKTVFLSKVKAQEALKRLEGKQRKAFEEMVQDIVQEKLNGDMIEKIIEEKLKGAISDACDSLFKWSGEGKKLIENKLKDIMLPALEQSEFSEYTKKLDVALS